MQGSFGAQPAYMSPPQMNSNPFGMVHQQQPQPVPVSMQNNPFAMQAAPQAAVMGGMAANPYSQMNNQMANMNLTSNPFAQQQQMSHNNATVRLYIVS